MRPNEYDNPAGGETRCGGRFDLFFYEQVGTRYYLRFTRLALVLVVCLTVVPAVAIFALFVTNSHADLENVNVNISVEPRAPGNYGGSHRHTATNEHAHAAQGRSPRGGDPVRQTPAAPTVNANAPPTPSPTPSPTPPRPPS